MEVVEYAGIVARAILVRDMQLVHDVQLVHGVPVAVIESAVKGAGYTLAVVDGTRNARKRAPGISVALALLDSYRDRL